MPQIPQQNTAAGKDSRVLLTQIIREIRGVNTNASRIAIPDNQAYNLENIIPIGPQNLHSVANISTQFVNYGADTIYWAQGWNLNNREFIISFSTTGKVFFFDVAANTSVQVNTGSGNILSGAGSRCTQWEDSAILFIDSTGYYSYDGTTFQKITGSGVPSSGNDIAVYAGRVWIAQGRLLILSGANDFTAASFLPANGAAFVSLVDTQIRSTIQRMTVVSGLLYLYATTGINVISNVTVPLGSVPPSPIFLNTNIQPLIGTDQPASVNPYNQFTLLANRYGIYKLYGLNMEKISTDIDGTWQYVDFNQQISGGQVTIENILCSAFLIKRLNDPVFGSNTVMAIYFMKNGQDTWFFGNFGSISLLVTTYVKNQATLYAYINNGLYRLFSDSTTAPSTQVMTKLYPLEDDLARKEVIRVGFLAHFDIFGSQISLTEDTQTQSFDSGITLSLTQGLWQNAFGITGFWQNASGTIGGWGGAGPYLSSGQGVAMHDHYVGLTLNTVGYKYELNLMAFDYKLCDRWA